MSGDKGISAFPNGDDVFSWIGTIIGPKGTVSLHLMFFSLKYFFTCLLF
jgi:hypothetical protein